MHQQHPGGPSAGPSTSAPGPTCQQRRIQLHCRVAGRHQPQRHHLLLRWIQRHHGAGSPAVLRQAMWDVGPGQAMELHEARAACHRRQQSLLVSLHLEQGIPRVGCWRCMALLQHWQDVLQSPAHTAVAGSGERGVDGGMPARAKAQCRGAGWALRGHQPASGCVRQWAAQAEHVQPRAGLAQRTQRVGADRTGGQVCQPQVWHAPNGCPDAAVAEQVAAAAQVQYVLPLVCQQQQGGVAQQPAQACHRQQARFGLGWQ